jgi:hypothetical protein
MLASRDSVVGIAARYGLVDPGIESLWGRDFPHPSRLALGSTQPPIQYLFSWVKRPGRGVNNPSTFSAEVEERAALHLLPLWAFMAYSRANFTF